MKKASVVSRDMGVGKGRTRGEEYKGAGGNFRGDECLQYLDCGDCFIAVHMSKLIKMNTLNIYRLYLNYTSIMMLKINVIRTGEQLKQILSM